MNITTQDIFYMLLLALAIKALYDGTQRISQGYCRIVERFGKYHRTLAPGITFIIPFIDKIINIQKLNINDIRFETEVHIVENNTDLSLKETVLNPNPYSIIAADNAKVDVDVVAYIRIYEPNKAIYNVENVIRAVDLLIETTVRQEVARMNSDNLISSRESLSAKLVSSLNEVSDGWGLKVTRVEVQDINFSDPDVKKALDDARTQELIRRGQLVAAQAERDMRILEAEGIKQSAMLQAEGEKQAAILKAEGELAAREALAKGYAAITSIFTDNAEGFKAIRELEISLKAIDAQKEVAQSLSKSKSSLIVPTDVAGLLGAFGAVQNAINFSHKNTDKTSEKLTNKTID